MREDFVDPIPELASNATLMFGRTPVDCHVSAILDERFQVFVPSIEQYEGDPDLSLITDRGCYQVRLILQEPMAGGYSYMLKIRNETEVILDDAITSKSIRLGTRCCTAAMIAVAIAGLCMNPGSYAAMMQLAGVQQKAAVETPVVAPTDSQLQPVEQVIVASHEQPESEPQDVTNIRYNTSLVSNSARLVRPTLAHSNKSDQFEQSSGHFFGEAYHLKSRTNLAALLEEGQSGLVRNVDPYLLSKLLGVQASKSIPAFRSSQVALQDLNQFVACLDSLPASDADQSALHMQQLLQGVATQKSKGQKLHGKSGLHVLKNDNVSVYYRVDQGRVELVRILPTNL